MIDQATHYKSRSPVAQHQVFQSLFKAFRKNTPKSSLHQGVPLGQDEKQIHIYQSLNKKTINHRKYLMQRRRMFAEGKQHGVWSYSGIQGKVKYWLSLQICITYTWHKDMLPFAYTNQGLLIIPTLTTVYFSHLRNYSILPIYDLQGTVE